MRKRIPIDMNNSVYEFYDLHIRKGTPITSIAELFNNKYHTDFAESSLRNRFEKVKMLNVSEMSVEEFYEKELALSKKEGKIRSEQHKLTRLRSNLSHEIKKNADKSLVAEIFGEVWGEVEANPTISHIVKDDTANSQTFLYGDVHMGYTYDGHYDIPTAIRRLEEVYSIISSSIKETTKYVRIGDLADHIEGRSLRITQLESTAGDMSEQTKLYTDAITKLLLQLCEKHPTIEFNFCIITDDNHSQLRLFGTGRNELHDNMATLIADSVVRAFDLLHYTGSAVNMSITAGKDIIIQHGNGLIGVYTHGHQYSGNDKDMLRQVKIKHGDNIAYIVRAHFHRYSNTTQEINDGNQVSVITIPAVVGRTDYSDRLFLGSHQGMLEFDYDESNGYANSRFIKLTA